MPDITKTLIMPDIKEELTEIMPDIDKLMKQSPLSDLEQNEQARVFKDQLDLISALIPPKSAADAKAINDNLKSAFSTVALPQPDKYKLLLSYPNIIAHVQHTVQAARSGGGGKSASDKGYTNQILNNENLYDQLSFNAGQLKELMDSGFDVNNGFSDHIFNAFHKSSSSFYANTEKMLQYLRSGNHKSFDELFKQAGQDYTNTMKYFDTLNVTISGMNAVNILKEQQRMNEEKQNLKKLDAMAKALDIYAQERQGTAEAEQALKALQLAQQARRNLGERIGLVDQQILLREQINANEGKIQLNINQGPSFPSEQPNTNEKESLPGNKTLNEAGRPVTDENNPENMYNNPQNSR